MEQIEEFIIRDKFTNIQQVAELLKEEVESISRNFFLLSGDVVVRFKRQENNFIFDVEIPASRIKPFGNKFI